jgi:hypothetical protein
MLDSLADVEARQTSRRISGGAICSGCDWHLCEVPAGIGDFLTSVKVMDGRRLEEQTNDYRCRATGWR